MSRPELIDDFTRLAPLAANGARWEFVADTVMGGVSTGGISFERTQGEPAMRLTGEISLENNGGFVQAALDLGGDAGEFDASNFTGIEITARSNGGAYAVNLRTSELHRPWQSYRHEIETGEDWRVLRLPFEGFDGSNTDLPLNPAKLRRIGIIAVGEAMAVDIAVSELRFY